MRTAFYGLLFFMFLSPVAYATNYEKYTNVSFSDLTKFSAHYKSIDLNDSKAFLSYLQATECDIYNDVKDSLFKQQEVRQAILQSYEATKGQDRELYFRVPAIFYVSSYNFDTQSFTLMLQSQLKRVNNMDLLASNFQVCNNQYAGRLEKIPTSYTLKLNFPVSLYRIPLQRNVAETLFSKLDTYYFDAKIRVIYGYIYVQIEVIQPEIIENLSRISATIRGQVNGIDLFIDKDRKNLLKRLDYADSF